jgi:hypothetical protein
LQDADVLLFSQSRNLHRPSSPRDGPTSLVEENRLRKSLPARLMVRAGRDHPKPRKACITAGAAALVTKPPCCNDLAALLDATSTDVTA